jgi:hypothetical protein
MLRLREAQRKQSSGHAGMLGIACLTPAYAGEFK